jgi:hypothetical protein
MGAQVRYGTIAVGAYMAHQPGSHQRAFTDQYEPKWDRGGARAPKTRRDPMRWDSLWSFGCRIGGGDVEGYSQGVGMSSADPFEPFSCDGDGNQSVRFIRGTCLDQSSAPVANAIVQGFVTSTDAYVGQDVSREDGTYLCPTDTLPGVQHYLVAYKPGSPDIAGTTVNTLTSTNVDGT